MSRLAGESLVLRWNSKALNNSSSSACIVRTCKPLKLLWLGAGRNPREWQGQQQQLLDNLHANRGKAMVAINEAVRRLTQRGQPFASLLLDRYHTYRLCLHAKP